MVDVADRQITAREATAIGLVSLTPDTIDELRKGEGTAELMATARVAGIGGAKHASDLIPLAHSIRVHGVEVDLEITDDGILIQACVRANDVTGPRMEALTAVTAAGLTLVDMLSSTDRTVALRDLMVVATSGGRRGPWRREIDALPNWAFED